MAYKNLHLHNEIRNWTTEQLIETLEFNGLGECSDAIRTKQIDGEEFLNLSEGQLALWRNVLNTTQTRRLWSIIQLAKERPQDFVKSNSQNTTSTKLTTATKPPVPTVTRHTPTKQPTPTKSPVPTVTRHTPLPPTIPVHFDQPTAAVPTVARNTPLLPTAAVKIFDNLPPPRVVEPLTDRSPVVPTRPPLPAAPTKPSKPEEPITSIDRKPFAASLNNLLSQQLAIKDDGQVSPSSGNVGNYPLHKLRRKLSTTSLDSSSSIDSLPLPPKPHSRQPSPTPNETRQKSPTPNTYRPPPFPTNPAIPADIFPSQTSTSQLPPVRSRVNNYPNVSIITPPTFRQVPSPAWAGNRPLPSPPKDQQPYIRQVTTLPRPPTSAPIDIQVDYELPLEDDDAEYFFVDEVDLNVYKEQTWYKIVNRKEAKIILKGSQNGAFVVRPGKTDEHECSFSVMCDKHVYNIPVTKAGGKFVMGNTVFDTVVGIVDHFTAHPLVLNGPNGQDILVKLRRN